MTAILLLRERVILTETAFVEAVVWQLPQRLPGSAHAYKYRLALIVDRVCVLRYDNEAGKGDHKHIGHREASYRFVSLDALQRDFWADVEAWRKKQ